MLIVSLFAWSAQAESFVEIQIRKPELFHPVTGFRAERYRAPIPDDIPPPARVASIDDLHDLIRGGALLVDVYGARNSRYDELDGGWRVNSERLSIPGAIWLPEVGRGVLAPGIAKYLEIRLAERASGRQVVVFCTADCWMSWNAAQRVAALGHDTWWWPLGVDGWLDEGRSLTPVTPVPVPVD